LNNVQGVVPYGQAVPVDTALVRTFVEAYRAHLYRQKNCPKKPDIRLGSEQAHFSHAKQDVTNVFFCSGGSS